MGSPTVKVNAGLRQGEGRRGELATGGAPAHVFPAALGCPTSEKSCILLRMTKKQKQERLFELVYFRIYDVGRAVSLECLEGSEGIGTPGASNRFAPIRRDTPSSLSLPVPCVLSLQSAESAPFGTFRSEAKIYEDGAVTISLRARARVSLETLNSLVSAPIVSAPAGMAPGGVATLFDWSDTLFKRTHEKIYPHIQDPAAEPGREEETYIAFCLLECPEGPEAYIRQNRTALASLLMEADTGGDLHEQKIAETLATPFSYTPSDLAIFDLDRCFIIDPKEGYEDILLIIEHANYRLLELRVLDRLLDKRLDEAERDLGSFTRRGRSPVGAVRKKFARIQSLRFVALFVLENLENSSKIIGDYYLGQIYDRLCAMFNTEGWSRSVERRLDVLTSIYEMVKTDNAERRTLVLEIVFIAVCIILPVIQIWQALL